MNSGYIAAFMLLGLLCPPFSISQSITPKPGDLILEANKQLRFGRTDSAKALFESALLMDDKSVPARIGLGKAAIQEEQWSDGCDIFTEVLDRDPANLFAQYGAGICYREYGTQVGLFMRNIQWGKATDYFVGVIARDSSFEDVLFQLAVLLRYKKDYRRAFALGHRQSALRPDKNEASLGLFRIYRSYIAEENPQEALDSLAHMQSDHATFFSGEVMRRQGKLDGAERVFLDLLSMPRQVPSEVIFSLWPACILEKGQPARAEEIYWRAVDRSPPGWVRHSSLKISSIFSRIPNWMSTGPLSPTGRKRPSFVHSGTFEILHPPQEQTCVLPNTPDAFSSPNGTMSATISVPGSTTLTRCTIFSFPSPLP